MWKHEHNFLGFIRLKSEPSEFRKIPSTLSSNFRRHHNNFLKWICNCTLKTEPRSLTPNSTPSNETLREAIFVERTTFESIMRRLILMFWLQQILGVKGKQWVKCVDDFSLSLPSEVDQQNNWARLRSAYQPISEKHCVLALLNNKRDDVMVPSEPLF